jgi:hypothetical protein
LKFLFEVVLAEVVTQEVVTQEVVIQEVVIQEVVIQEVVIWVVEAIQVVLQEEDPEEHLVVLGVAVLVLLGICRRVAR